MVKIPSLIQKNVVLVSYTFSVILETAASMQRNLVGI